MIVFGRYELLALLARGGLAEIWLARQRGMAGFEKLVVVKRLHERLQRDPEYVDMFLDEARINARLQHTNVLQVHELGEVDGRYFLAMEYVEGMPLGVLARKAIARLGDVPIAICGGLIAQAAHGMHYAHEATAADGTPLAVVHRDLSPLNLLVGFEGVLKVADFGVAKAEGRRTRTRSGVIKGTPTYMSPEHCTGGEVDRRSDVFGLGILLWELLTGRRLFKRPTAEETYDAITSGRVPTPSTYRLELPAALDRLVLRALALDPDDRFATAAELGVALEGALHKDGLRAEVVDIRTFLTEHFPGERHEQEELVARVRQGGAPGDAPIFAQAEHGLDSEDDGVAPALVANPAFLEGDTAPDPYAPAHDEAPAPASPTVHEPPASPPVSAAAARGRARRGWLVFALLLLVGAIVAGLIAGRAHR